MSTLDWAEDDISIEVPEFGVEVIDVEPEPSIEIAVIRGIDGQGIDPDGAVDSYANLPTDLTAADAGDVYVTLNTGLIYIWTGSQWPTQAQGIAIQGPKGDQGEQGIQGFQGIQGIQGLTGNAGPANTLTIGGVVSGDEADAAITGVSPNQVLNLTLPRGEQGEQGVQGAQGEQGETGQPNSLTIGTVSSGAAGATITGDAPAQVLNLSLPKGDKGDKGDPGGSAWADVTGKPSTYPPSAHTHDAADLTSGTLDIARIPVGTSGTTVCVGNDSRLSDARTPTAHGHAASDIVSGTIAYARLPVGATASTVAAGNDSRLTDTRTPTDGTVTTAKIVDGAVTTGKLGAEQVTYAKMAVNSVGGYNIIDAAVGTSELADGAVTPAKMGTGRVVGQVNGVATSTVIERMTAAQYAAATKDANTVYIVT